MSVLKFFSKHWEHLVLSILGTTISILLTFGVNKMIGKSKQQADRRLAAVRVMSNIEAYARQLDRVHDHTMSADTMANYILLHQHELDKFSEQTLLQFVLTSAPDVMITYDNSAEQIFTSSFDIWRNVDNARFIDVAGQSFHTMSIYTEEFNKWINAFIGHADEFMHNHKADYASDKDYYIAYLTDPDTLIKLEEVHPQLDRMRYVAAFLRWNNRQGMQLMKIREEDVMKEVASAEELDPDDPMPDADQYLTPRPELP